ncbi:MAG: hypothetical protein QXX36_00720 [Candidatus Rehaiarchaeum fermentans]|nr:hypothetical protein [Candidatus Rehaiarchaeum fermentans]MCW1297354.1 hypothetical protein [Candidatus Rehaiarchaeum fermentans]MCW1302145.1 hypothetical protein [Candidatus Rehaiarchaeum fermentans]
MERINLEELDFFRNYKSPEGVKFIVYKKKGEKEYEAVFTCVKCNKENEIKFEKLPKEEIVISCNYCKYNYKVPLLKIPRGLKKFK